MATTKDRYELPLAVGSCKEMAKYFGTTSESIRASWSHYKKGVTKRPMCQRVEIGLDELK